MSVQLKELPAGDELERGLAALESEFVATYPWFPEWLQAARRSLAAGARRLYAIYEDGIVAGVFLINIIDRTTVKANAMVISRAFRGRGLSVLAYNELFRALEGSAYYVFTQCKADNAVARRLIDRAGFVQIGYLRHLIEKSDDNLVFVRVLTPTVDLHSCVTRASQIYTEDGVKEFCAAIASA